MTAVVLAVPGLSGVEWGPRNICLIISVSNGHSKHRANTQGINVRTADWKPSASIKYRVAIDWPNLEKNTDDD